MSTDGRLDLDDLGEVIEQASSLDELRSGAADERPTLGERIVATGVPGWVRRHRAAIAGVTAVVVALGAFLWVRRDTRPPDDGLAHVAVLDSTSQSGIEMTTPGLLSTIYTLVAQRPGDSVWLVGISGPGIRATSAGRPVTDGHDASRSSTPVLAVLGCDDPATITAREDQYHLLVRRTDAYGRTVDAQVPMPVGSQIRWSQNVGGACLQSLASSRLLVESVRATPSTTPPYVDLRVGLRSQLDNDVAVDVLSYSGGLTTRPESTSVVVKAGSSAELLVRETIVDCSSPHLDGVIVSPDGQSGFAVRDRTIDAGIRAMSDNPDSSSAGISLTWSAAQARQVTAAFAAACAGLPPSSTQVLSAALAPPAVQSDALLRFGDPSVRIVRAELAVRTDAALLSLSDMLTPEDLSNGGTATIEVVFPPSGRRQGSQGRAGWVPVKNGSARVTLDWTVYCSGSYGPPSGRLALERDGRDWPVYLALDQAAMGRAVLRACPSVTLADLEDQGWTSLRTDGS